MKTVTIKTQDSIVAGVEQIISVLINESEKGSILKRKKTYTVTAKYVRHGCECTHSFSSYDEKTVRQLFNEWEKAQDVLDGISE